MNKLVLLALLLPTLALSSVACKNSDPISSTVAPATASFLAEAPPSGVVDHLVELRQRSVDGGRIVLEVVVTEVDEPVTAIALRLTYPETFSSFISCTDGDLFPPGDCFADEPSAESGEVFLGRAVSVNEATAIDGSRVAVQLEFLVFGVGSGMIRIEGQNLGGGDSSAVLDVNSDPIFVQWFAGMLQGE
jgi:hypothetical protein